MNKIIHFIKYNNFTILLILAIFVLGTGVFAASPPGRELIGGKIESIEGIDNSLLLDVNLAEFNAEYKIESIKEDEDYYYATYTYLDLVKGDSAWQYQLQEKVKKISKRENLDLGEYLAQELKEEYEARIKKLGRAKEKALSDGEQTRFEVSSYTGLIGATLDLADKVFPGYESVKKTEIPSPGKYVRFGREPIQEKTTSQDSSVEAGEPQPLDSIARVYDNYVAKNDPDNDDLLTPDDNCPNDYNPGQEDDDADGKGNVCDFDDLASVGDVSAGTSTLASTTPIEPDSEETASASAEQVIEDSPSSAPVSPPEETVKEPAADALLPDDNSAATEPEPVLEQVEIVEIN